MLQTVAPRIKFTRTPTTVKLAVTPGISTSYVTDTSADAKSPIASASGGRNRALRDFRSVLDFGTYTSGDMTAQFIQASDDARINHKKLYAPANKYLISNTINTVNMSTRPEPLWIEGDGPEATEFQMAPGMTNAVIALTGGLAASKAVTAPTAVGDNVLHLVNTTGLVAGQPLLVTDPTQPIMGNAGGPTLRGPVSIFAEWGRIKSVDSATQVTLWEALEFPYTTSAVVWGMIFPGSIHARGFSIRNLTPGTLAATARGIVMSYFYGVNFQDLALFDMDADGLYFQWGLDGHISDIYMRDFHDLETGNAPYGIAGTKATSHFLVDGVRSRYGRHLITLSGDTTYGSSAYWKISNSIATEHSAASFDTHPGARRITFENCESHNNYPSPAGATLGFQIRGPDTDIIDCKVTTVKKAGAGSGGQGISFIYGADRGRVQSTKLENVDIGVMITDSDDVFIGTDTLIVNPATNGIKTVVDTEYVGYMTKLTLGSVRIRGNPSGAAINNDSRVNIMTTGHVAAPDAATVGANYAAPAPKGGLGYTPTIVTANGIVIPPSGAGIARVLAVAGAGGGGGGSSTNVGGTAQGGSGGGGAGGITDQIVALAGIGTITATIGGGGQGGVAGAAGGFVGGVGFRGADTTLVGFLAAPSGVTAVASSGGAFAAATYFWKVTALNAAGETVGSNEVTLAVLANQQVLLSWAAIPGAASYKVYRALSAGGENGATSLVGSTGTNSLTDTGAATSAGAIPSSNTAVVWTVVAYGGTGGGVSPVNSVTAGGGGQPSGNGGSNNGGRGNTLQGLGFGGVGGSTAPGLTGLAGGNGVAGSGGGGGGSGSAAAAGNGGGGGLPGHGIVSDGNNAGGAAGVVAASGTASGVPGTNAAANSGAGGGAGGPGSSNGGAGAVGGNGGSGYITIAWLPA